MATAVPSEFVRAQEPVHSLGIALACAGFAFVACYARFFVLPGTPILPGGDQLGFMESGARIASGQLPYRDYFEMLPPGTPYFYAAMIKLFGLYNWIMPATMATLASLCVLLMTLATGRVLRGFALVLPGLWFTGLVLVRSADATHHWFSTVFGLLALLILLNGLSFSQVALAGVMCGLAACFTQSKGAGIVVGFAAYLIWKWRSGDFTSRECTGRCFVLCGTAFVVFAALNFYFVRAAGFSRWLFQLVIYPLRYYPVPPINNWRVVKYDFEWHRSAVNWIAFPFVYATVPLVYFVVLWAIRRRSGTGGLLSRDQLLLITLTGLGMFLAIAGAPSVKRLCTVSPPAMILLAWLLSRPGAMVKAAKYGIALLALGLVFVMAVNTQVRPRFDLALPAGRTAFIDRDVYDEYQWMKANTHPGEYFWGMPPFYVHFHLQNPAAVGGVGTTEYTRPEQVAEAVEALKSHSTPLIILPSENSYPLDVKDRGNHAGPFLAYLRSHYRLTRTFANGDEDWERIEGSAPGR